MVDNVILLAILSVATWRVSYALAVDEGPWGVFAKLRKARKGVTCVACTSVWVAGGLSAVAWRTDVVMVLLGALAGSGLALILNAVLPEEREDPLLAMLRNDKGFDDTEE